MVVLVALAMALAAGTAYAAYRVYTDMWLPAQQAQNEQTVEAPEEITYSVETRSMDVSVPVDPYDAPGKREAQKWYYPHIEASTQSDAVDKINAALEESMRTDVEKTNAAPDTAEDMGGAIVFICQYRSITLTYIDNDIVCVRDQRYDTGWGPHGSTTVTGCAYSLETGDPIDPVSAFGLTPEQAKSAVADAVTAYLATDPSDVLSTNAVVRDITNMCLMSPALGSGVDVENPLDGCSHFYIASEGLVFATEDHQMGSYAYGRREIVVAPSDGSLAKVGDTVAIEAPMGFSGSGQIPSQSRDPIVLQVERTKGRCGENMGAPLSQGSMHCRQSASYQGWSAERCTASQVTFAQFGFSVLPKARLGWFGARLLPENNA